MIEKITKTQAIRELANKQSILIYGNYKDKKEFSNILQHFDKLEYKASDFDFEDWRFCDRVCATFLQLLPKKQFTFTYQGRGASFGSLYLYNIMIEDWQGRKTPSSFLAFLCKAILLDFSKPGEEKGAEFWLMHQSSKRRINNNNTKFYFCFYIYWNIPLIYVIFSSHFSIRFIYSMQLVIW